MSNIYLKIKQYWKQIAKYAMLTGMTLGNLLFIHLFVTSIELTKDGAFIKTIDENAKEWFYRSAELFILSFKIDIVVIILFIMLSKTEFEGDADSESDSFLLAIWRSSSVNFTMSVLSFFGWLP